MPSKRSGLDAITHAFRIAYALTKSDYKTVVIPCLTYGLLSSPKLTPNHLPRLITWIWLYLAQFCIANQMFSGDEDAINKPYRPIPAGLVSARTAIAIRWLLIPICLYLSFVYDVVYPGVSLTLAFLVYNELGLGDFWYTKNVLNAVGLVSWNVGAAKLSGHETAGEWIIPYISTFLISTTIHVQDFRDESGDRLSGRSTFPVVLPHHGRPITFVLVLLWTIGLAVYWDISKLGALAYTMLGTYLATRVLVQRSLEEDKRSLQLYMVWLCASQVLPFVSRHISRLDSVTVL